MDDEMVENLCEPIERRLFAAGWKRTRLGWIDPESALGGKQPYHEERQIAVTPENDRLVGRAGSPVMTKQLVLPPDGDPMTLAAALAVQEQRDNPEP
jgi:hypothetical protein